MNVEGCAPCVLTTGAADRYLDRVSGLLSASHLNALFPSAQRLQQYLSALHSRTHGGLYPKLRVALASGLPSPREWMRVQTDAALSKSVISSPPPPPDPMAAMRSASPKERLLKRNYCARLLALAIAPLDTISVELRQLDMERGALHVRIVADTVYDSGLLARYTVELSEVAPVGERRRLLAYAADEIRISPRLSEQLTAICSMTAEQGFIALSALPGIKVKRVIKGIVGPFYLAELPKALPLSPLLTNPRGAFATFALDSATCDRASDIDHDPLSHLLLKRTATPATPTLGHSRQRLPYRVCRDRKFVTDPATQPALENLCRSTRTPNLIYTAALGSAAGEASI